MDNETKIHLSPFEMDLVTDPKWILTKNNILKKVQRLLESVQENMLDYTALHRELFSPEILASPPKISKGENYNGLPWRILDYPRYFNKENIFAIRTLFWWGNFFSTTLHLSGKYKREHQIAISAFHKELCKNQFYICIHEEQWHHHFEKGNYLPVKDFTENTFHDLIKERPFIKLSCQCSFSDWDIAIKLLSENFVRITKWLA
jgi:hypothetical protein